MPRVIHARFPCSAALLLALAGCRSHPARPLGELRPEGTLRISSLEARSFAVAGRVDGRFAARSDSIIVELDSALVTYRPLFKDQTPLHLDSITVGLGWYVRGNRGQWDTAPGGRAIPIAQPLMVGDTVRLGASRLAILRDTTVDLRRRWLIVTFHQSFRQPTRDGYVGEATSYAHSARNLFVRESQ